MVLFLNICLNSFCKINDKFRMVVFIGYLLRLLLRYTVNHAAVSIEIAYINAYYLPSRV